MMLWFAQLHPLHSPDSSACILWRWYTSGTYPIHSCVSAALWLQHRTFMSCRKWSEGVVPLIFWIFNSLYDCCVSLSAFALMFNIFWCRTAVWHMGKCLLRKQGRDVAREDPFCAASLACTSTHSFPLIPSWPGTHHISIIAPLCFFLNLRHVLFSSVTRYECVLPTSCLKTLMTAWSSVKTMT